MARRRHGCRLCSGHGQHIPVGHCNECRNPVCDRHITWDEEWLCTRCKRAKDSRGSQ